MWHSCSVQEADKYPESTNGAYATRSPRDIAWVLAVGLAPLLVLVLTMAAVALSVRRDSSADVLGSWNLYVVFGITMFAPIMVIACIGALALIASFPVGRAISSIGNAAAIVCMTILVYAEIAVLITPAADRDPDSWVAALTPSGTALVVVPYLALLAANAYVITRLWRTRP